MRQDGDTYGPTIMRLRNRTGENGAIFETTDGTITLVDFIFKTASNQRNIRYESRVANARTGNPSFHIGGLLPDKPTLSIGDNYAAFGKSVTIGRYTQPTARLQIGAGTADTAALKFTSGPLLATPQAGAVEFLTDKFYGTITTGAARKTFAFLESPAFTTPNIGAATGTSLQLSGLTTSRPVKTDGSGNLTATQIALNSTNDVSGTLPIANGGTNNGSLDVTNGGVIYTDGGKLMNTGVGSTGQVLESNGSAPPTWGYPSLTSFENYLGANVGLGVNTYSGALASITLPAGTWLITSETTITYSNAGTSTYWRATVALGTGNATTLTTAYTSGEGSTRVQAGGGAGPIQISLSKIVTLAAPTLVSTYAAASVAATVVITPPNNPSTAGTATGIHAVRID
jgi:hypothetical protein